MPDHPPAPSQPFTTGVESPRYLTADIPGTGGLLKQRPEDFLVEEIPLYHPAGEGEHIYLFVEKQRLTTLQLRDTIARHFKVDRRAIGHAGLKDKHAITRQVISVHAPGRTPEDFPSFQHDRAAILWVDLHTNKLERGHLAGNRFSIKVRGVDPMGVRHARAALTRLAAHGVPNRFGEQRFGYLGNNHLVGRAMILGRAGEALDLMLSPRDGAPRGSVDSRAAYAAGDYREAYELMPKVFKNERNALRALANGKDAAGAMRALDQTAASFFISSFQSAVFNAVLNRRVEEGMLDRLVEGDLAFVMKNRALFEVTAEELEKDPAGLEKRLGLFEVSASGPMWGTSMPTAGGKIGEVEAQALAITGVTTKDLELCEARDGLPMIGGDRRPMRIPVIDPEVEGGIDEHGSYIRCAFELPRGSFATTVMDEVMKVSVSDPEDADGS